MRAGGGTSGPLAITSREEEKQSDMAPAVPAGSQRRVIYTDVSALCLARCWKAAPLQKSPRGAGREREVAVPAQVGGSQETWPSPALICWPRSAEGSQPGTPFPLLRCDRGWWPGKGGDDGS